MSVPSCVCLEPRLSSCGATVYIVSADTSLTLSLCLLCLFLPPSLLFPFYGQHLYSRIGVRDANEEVAEPLPLPKTIEERKGRICKFNIFQLFDNGLSLVSHGC